MRHVPAAVLLFALIAVLPQPAGATESRPVEGRWEVLNARFSDTAVHPARHYYKAGEEGTALFVVDPRHRALFDRCKVTWTLADGLDTEEDPGLVASRSGAVRAFRFTSLDPGTRRVGIRIENPEDGFALTYEIEFVFVVDTKEVPAPRKSAAVPVILDASPGPVDAAGVKAAVAAAAPVNYARIQGIAATYEYPDVSRRYMLRGIKLELWDTTSLLGTVYTSDAMGEGNCDTDFEDYVDTTTATWSHVTNSGWFDFGDVYVGTGKSLRVKMVFEYYAAATGDNAAGIHRTSVVDHDSGEDTIVQWWNLGTAHSGDDLWFGLYSAALDLSSTNGLLSDEAMHAHLDMSRMYHYFRGCTGFYIDLTTAHLWLSSADAPSSGGDDLWLRAWDNGYLTYYYTDSIRHEYSHAAHYKMRGGSFPPWGPGDENHGGCDNATSSDGLTEGWARHVPTMIYRDGVYHWTATSTRDMSTTSNYCVAPIPDERHEWAFGKAMWKSWDNAGQTNSFVNCIADALDIHDPDYVEDYMDFLFADCDYDYEIWAGFFHNSMDWDDTAPFNPTSVTVTPNRRWTNDTTPIWSWSGATDDMSRIDGYAIWVGPAAASPGTIKDVEEVDNYTPAPLADANAYYFSIRSVDNSGNWATGYSWDGPIGIDTVQPVAVGGLTSTSHTPEVWSNDPDIVLTWTAAYDDRSGVDGYGISTSTSSPSLPGTVKDIEEVTTYTVAGVVSSTGGRYFNIRTVDQAGNWDSHYVSAGPYYIDVTQPATVTGLTSTSHTPGVWSKDTTIDFAWTAAADAHSGIDGYGLFWATSAGQPSTVKDIEEVTSYTQSASTSTSGYYLNIRSKDNAGNWDSDHASAGPYYVETVAPAGPTSLYSTSHAISTWSNDTTIDFTWVGAHDEHSGIDGYGISWSSGPALPGAVKDIEETPATYTYTATTSASGRYFNMRAVDNAGNWEADSISTGPFLIDAVAPVPPSNLGSPTHPAGSCTTDTPMVTMTWVAATDAHSGLAGYSFVLSSGATADPDKVVDLSAGATSQAMSLAYSPNPRYYNLNAADAAGNWSSVAAHGPFVVDRTPPDVSPLLVNHYEKNPAGVTLAWTPAAGTAGYQIDRSLQPGFGIYDTYVTTASTWIDPAPPAGTVVYYRVRGVNACGVTGD